MANKLSQIQVTLVEGTIDAPLDVRIVQEIITRVSQAIYLAAAGEDYRPSLRFWFGMQIIAVSSAPTIPAERTTYGLADGLARVPSDIAIFEGSVVGRARIAQWIALAVLGGLISNAMEQSKFGQAAADVGAAAIDSVADTAVEIGRRVIEILRSDGTVHLEGETLHLVLPRRPPQDETELVGWGLS